MKNAILIVALALFSIAPAFAKPKYIGMKKAKAIAMAQATGKIKSSRA